jgi:ATP-dependent helicase/nuclease subunit A
MMSDQQARQTALDTQHSFLVQAPAGSGKTELLTQRFLKLLTQVKSPEEIIAITFTRKAAGEMRERIIDALHLAASKQKPSEAHKQCTFELASKALIRDSEFNWQLIANPNRLRILTIDALAGFLSAQIPILSGFGSKPDISDNVSTLYEEAARELITTITQDTPWKPQLEILLLHLDNQASRVIELLCSILSKREQWLPHILTYHGNLDLLHEHLDIGLSNIADEAINQAYQALGDNYTELLSLAKHAAQTLAENDNLTHPVLQLLNINELELNHEHLSYWQSFTDLVLTQKDEIRKSIDKRQGFLPKTHEKTRIRELLDTFRDNPNICLALSNLKYCPPVYYPDAQREMIDALTHLLPILYAQLRLIFQQHNKIDFVELNLAAQRALGDETEPTDLALYLDYQIQHLLIDEFQDTSITQYYLLQGLTRGWETGDGRTLFLVGDPMQSIYRFRDAEVGLFIRAQTQPINNIYLTTLVLQNNYRSDKKIVDWINNTFSHIFPQQADISQGAVPYSPSTSTRDFNSNGISCHLLVDQNRNAEAEQIIKDIQQIQQHHADDSIAILVRSRNQLTDIIHLLHQEQIHFTAVDLETLINCPEIQDLLTLIRVILHRQDHIAWYALLRSPICGLTLADLQTISQQLQQGSIWHVLQHCQLSTDSMQRVKPIVQWLSFYFEQECRLPFELAVRGLWQALGYATLLSPQQIQNCDNLFDLIATLSNDGHAIDYDSLYQALRKTYIQPQEGHSQVSIMTIHKSKGLEFDHVFLPGLNQKSGSDKHDLMLWLERPNLLGDIDFILAPIKQATSDNDAIYRYLQRIEQCKLEFESARLLYVAATRAKQSLHLYACIENSKKGELQYKSGSFAALLKDQLQNHAEQIEENNSTEIEISNKRLLTRINQTWQSPYAYPNILPPTANPLPELDSYVKRIIGTVIHEVLADSAHFPLEIEKASKRLKQAGIIGPQLAQALDMLQLVSINIQHDPRAQWIFDDSHSDIHNEFPISSVYQGKIRHFIIDRTFIDNSNVRWIIDYKTSTPDNGDHQIFLQEQVLLYQPQLSAYAHAFRGLEDREIRTALYFPVCKLWTSCDLIAT